MPASPESNLVQAALLIRIPLSCLHSTAKVSAGTEVGQAWILVALLHPPIPTVRARTCNNSDNMHFLLCNYLLSTLQCIQAQSSRETADSLKSFVCIWAHGDSVSVQVVAKQNLRRLWSVQRHNDLLVEGDIIQPYILVATVTV